MELVVFVIVVAGIAVVGIGVGILLAPVIGRLSPPDDEEPRD